MSTTETALSRRVRFAPAHPELPSALARAFRVVDERLVKGMEHVRAMAQAAGMPLCLTHG